MIDESKRVRMPVPPILRKPIEASEFDVAKQRAQRRERISAVYSYYGFDETCPDAAERLVEVLAAERFRGGFKLVLKGTPKTKKRVWTWAQKNDLLEFVRNALLSGSSLEEAADEYRRLYCPTRGSTKGLLAEFHRAEKWERAGILDEQERKELNEWAIDYLSQRDLDIRLGK